MIQIPPTSYNYGIKKKKKNWWCDQDILSLGALNIENSLNFALRYWQ